MKITLLCVGKLKEKYWEDAVKEYSKRLSSYCDLKIIEVKDIPQKDESLSGEKLVKDQEGKEILAKIPQGSFVITLEILGKSMSSEDFSKKLQDLAITGNSDVTFIIGGSLGLSAEVSERADMKLSFSPMTYPHQMMRVILLEQIYRAFKIIRGEKYHK